MRGAPSEASRRAALGVFFGCGIDDVAGEVVLTPIPAFYRSFLESADEVSEYRGWWRLATVRRGDRRCSVALHFEGTRIVDPAYALVGTGSRVVFLGLVGGIDPDLALGDLVRITSGVRKEGPVHSWPDGSGAGHSDPGWGRTVRALTVDGLLEDPRLVRASAGRTRAQVVDLEAYHLFGALGVCRPVDALLLAHVTDRPGVVPFWDVPLGDGELMAWGADLRDLVLRHWWPPESPGPG